MDIIASVLSVSALIAAWLYAVKQLSTVHVALRHALGALVGLVAMFVVVLMFVFIGVFAPQGQNAAALDYSIGSFAVVDNGGHKCRPYPVA